MKRMQASSHLQIENSQVIVTRWDFLPVLKQAGIAMSITMSLCRS